METVQPPLHVGGSTLRVVVQPIMLTPPALAKHWKRVYEETHRRPKDALKTNAEKVAKWPAYLRVYSSAYLRSKRP